MPFSITNITRIILGLYTYSHILLFMINFLATCKRTHWEFSGLHLNSGFCVSKCPLTSFDLILCFWLFNPILHTFSDFQIRSFSCLKTQILISLNEFMMIQIVMILKMKVFIEKTTFLLKLPDRIQDFSMRIFNITKLQIIDLLTLMGTLTSAPLFNNISATFSPSLILAAMCRAVSWFYNGWKKK